MLHFIDDVATGEERLVPMTRAHADPYRHLANREISDPMHALGMLHAEALDRLRDDALPFFDGEGLEGLVFEMSHAVPLVVVAHPTLERRIAATRRIREPPAHGLNVDRGSGELESGHVRSVKRLSRRRPAE